MSSDAPPAYPARLEADRYPVLLFTGRYPRAIYDFVMGMHPRLWRVVAYPTLMTDAYPPFRLDMGSREPGAEDPAADAEGPEAAPA